MKKKGTKDHLPNHPYGSNVPYLNLLVPWLRRIQKAVQRVERCKRCADPKRKQEKKRKEKEKGKRKKIQRVRRVLHLHLDKTNPRKRGRATESERERDLCFQLKTSAEAAFLHVSVRLSQINFVLRYRLFRVAPFPKRLGKKVTICLRFLFPVLRLLLLGLLPRQQQKRKMDNDYLQRNVTAVLSEGLAAVVLQKPQDPVDFLGKWLLSYVDNEELKAKVSTLSLTLAFISR